MKHLIFLFAFIFLAGCSERQMLEHERESLIFQIEGLKSQIKEKKEILEQINIHSNDDIYIVTFEIYQTTYT